MYIVVLDPRKVFESFFGYSLELGALLMFCVYVVCICSALSYSMLCSVLDCCPLASHSLPLFFHLCLVTCPQLYRSCFCKQYSHQDSQLLYPGQGDCNDFLSGCIDNTSYLDDRKIAMLWRLTNKMGRTIGSGR